jgi:hypothetical protein
MTAPELPKIKKTMAKVTAKSPKVIDVELLRTLQAHGYKPKKPIPTQSQSLKILNPKPIENNQVKSDEDLNNDSLEPGVISKIGNLISNKKDVFVPKAFPHINEAIPSQKKAIESQIDIRKTQVRLAERRTEKLQALQKNETLSPESKNRIISQINDGQPISQKPVRKTPKKSKRAKKSYKSDEENLILPRLEIENVKPIKTEVKEVVPEVETEIAENKEETQTEQIEEIPQEEAKEEVVEEIREEPRKETEEEEVYIKPKEKIKPVKYSNQEEAPLPAVISVVSKEPVVEVKKGFFSRIMDKIVYKEKGEELEAVSIYKPESKDLQVTTPDDYSESDNEEEEKDVNGGEEKNEKEDSNKQSSMDIFYSKPKKIN